MKPQLCFLKTILSLAVVTVRNQMDIVRTRRGHYRTLKFSFFQPHDIATFKTKKSKSLTSRTYYHII